MDWFTADEVERIREYSLAMDRSRQVEDTVLEIMYDKRLLKLFVPERYNGRMTELPEALRIFEEASRIDGNFGWLVTIGSGGGYFAASFPPDLSEDVFAGRKAVIAGSGSPTGQAVRVEGGYRVSGTWKYCSGAPFATTFTATAVVEGSEEVIAFAMKPEQAEIIEDWHAFGLRATGSHSIRVENAWIPEERVFQVGHAQYDSSPIYTYPFMPFAVTSFAAVALGIGNRFLDESAHFLETMRDPWKAANPDRVAVLQHLLDEGNRLLSEQRERFYEAVQISWEQHVDGKLTEESIDRVQRAGREAAASALSASQRIFPYLGMAALMEDQTLNLVWRDLQTACQHGALRQYTQPNSRKKG